MNHTHTKNLSYKQYELYIYILSYNMIIIKLFFNYKTEDIQIAIIILFALLQAHHMYYLGQQQQKYWGSYHTELLSEQSLLKSLQSLLKPCRHNRHFLSRESWVGMRVCCKYCCIVLCWFSPCVRRRRRLSLLCKPNIKFGEIS